MKADFWMGMRGMTTALLAATWLVAGCGGRDSGQVESAGVNTAQVEKSFEGAEAGTRSRLQEALSAVRSGDYEGATRRFRELASDAGLSEEQRQSLRDLLPRLQERIRETAGAVAGEAKDVAERAVEGVKDAAGQVRDAALDSSVVQGARDVGGEIRDKAVEVQRGAGDALDRLGDRLREGDR